MLLGNSHIYLENMATSVCLQQAGAGCEGVWWGGTWGVEEAEGVFGESISLVYPFFLFFYLFFVRLV